MWFWRFFWSGSTDSEDDMHDVNDAVESMEDDYCSSNTAVGYNEDDNDVNDAVESMEDDYCSSNTAVGYNEDDNDDGDEDYVKDYGDHGFDNDSVDPNDGSSSQQKNYIVLNEEDIRKNQENEITTVSTVLSASRLDASILLRHHHWSASNVHEAWFADEERVRKAIGLLETPVVRFPDAKELIICGICFETSPLDQFCSAACGHYFCNQCWSAYISTSINDGLGCLMLRCPQPSCGTAVGQGMINLLVSAEDKVKYARYLVRSYVEDNRKTKWCPAPGCDYAVEFDVGSENYDVFCLCSDGFCWNCKEEAHRPVDCGTVAKWMAENFSKWETLTTNWILANSKPCPKCKRPIQKTHGCMHMTCIPPCGFHFCWVCLRGLSDHVIQTGGFYSCNRYEAAKQEREFDENQRREMAKQSIQRYSPYYERWASHHSLRQRALAYLRRMPTLEEKLSKEHSLPESRLKFIKEAWFQIIPEAWVQIAECRRVLKWTYAYGYYLPESEHVKRQFFEYVQGEAEAGLERLQRCAEDLQAYLGPEPPETDFKDFRTKLVGLTKVTRNYFENLVRALENGLSDVDCKGKSTNPDDHGFAKRARNG